MAQHNKDVSEKGGAAREAIRSSQSHADALGLSSMNANLKAQADELEIKLATKIADMKAKYNLAD